MELPDEFALGSVPVVSKKIPTVESTTNGKEIIIEMIDGTIGVYHNESNWVCCQYEHKNWKEFLDDTGLESKDEMHSFAKPLTKSIQNVFPTVHKVYTAIL